MAQQNTSEEIDLGYLFKKSNDFIRSFVRAIFQVLAFYVKYWIILLVLVLLGWGYGYYVDSNSKKTYINEGIVIPNFESVDYLYKNINFLNNKIRQNDTTFLKNVFPSGYDRVNAIEIEPISDIYNAMTKSREQIDVFRILFQNQDLDKFVNDITTSKYFKYHKVSFVISGNQNTESVISDVLTYWNSNEHFRNYEKIYKENAELQAFEYRKMISQVDSIIQSYTSRTKDEVSNSGVIITENSNLHSLLERKEEIMNQLLEVELKQSDYTSVIKLVMMDYNVAEKSLSKKIKYPIYLIALFSFLFLILHLFGRLKRYSAN